MRISVGWRCRVRAPAFDQGVFYVAFSPEREDPGNTTVARHDIPKVVGGHDAIATELAATLYEGIFTRSRSCVLDARGRDDEAAGEHLSLREYCAGE